MTNENKLKLTFVEKEDGSIPCLSVNLKVEINDALLMFHICHMYRNSILVAEKESQPLEDILVMIDFQMIIKSLYASIENRLKYGESNYINEHYLEIKNNEKHFNDCLEIFSRCKLEFLKYREQYLYNFEPQSIINKKQGYNYGNIDTLV